MLERPLARRVPVDKQSLYIAAFFDEFLKRNSFSGGQRSSITVMHTILGTHESIPKVVSAIGALQIARSQTLKNRKCARDALNSYHGAVTALRSEIECARQGDVVDLAWCSLYLGCFEVSPVKKYMSFLLCVAEPQFLCSSCTTLRDKDGFAICCMGLHSYSSCCLPRDALKAAGETSSSRCASSN
jgi:hypothetical protein